MRYRDRPTIEIPAKTVTLHAPFGGDEFIADELVRLKCQFGCDLCVETGTEFGSTTRELAGLFSKVSTIEIDPDNFSVAARVLHSFSNVHLFYGLSPKWIPLLKLAQVRRTLYFLDAHGPAMGCPLLAELAAIGGTCLGEAFPVIVIHDFAVPFHPELGFDTYDGQALCWDYIRGAVEKIYGIAGYRHHYNSEFTPGSAQRGVVYITPNV